MKQPHVIVIGSGPGGLTAARSLAQSGQVEVTLIQRGGVAQYLPGILPVVLGLRPVSLYHSGLHVPHVHTLAAEVVRLQSGRVSLADGTTLAADAVIAAPGLLSSAPAPSTSTGSQHFAIWELDAASAASQAVQSLSSGRLVVAISSLPYRCPPAPYGLAIALKALMQERGRNVEVVLATPEQRPLQSLGEHASTFLETLMSEGNVALHSGFHLDAGASHDGLLVATDGRRIPYDLGLIVPPHRRPAFLADFPGNGVLVQVDASQHTPMDRTWVVGDVAATPLPRAAGVAEAQGRTAAQAVLSALGLGDTHAPVIPTPTCYVWTGKAHAARIQLRFPNGLPPAGKPDVILDAPTPALFAEALHASTQWLEQLEKEHGE
ncbi:MAG: FAD/NAD(P)-binding oxidoreductase [Ktedonobacteraceae bacterium]